MKKNMIFKHHPFHMLMPSPWPILMSLNMMNLFLSMITWFEFQDSSMFKKNLIIMMIPLILWSRDIIRESMFQGNHSMKIFMMLKFSSILFIISEFMLFISFFWTLFHMSISPIMEIGLNWPPQSILKINPMMLPLIGSILLIFSGFLGTISHMMMLLNKFKYSMLMMLFSMISGMLFLLIQLNEYLNSFFNFNDSIYSSIFYLITGFHGLHVLFGLMMLMFSYIRLLKFHYSKIHHIMFEFSWWYWHFVDIIWLFVYLFLYWWSM